VEWTLGKIDDKVVPKPKFATDSEPPPGYRRLSGDDNLIDALREGRIDALATAHTPASVYERDGEFRRLLRDYRQAERDYHRRKGFRPAMHLIAVNRNFGERHPEAVLALYRGLRASWEYWWARYKRFPDATPWAVEGVEDFIRNFPEEIPPYGTQSPAHRRLLDEICKEQYEQKLVKQAAKPGDLFAFFDALR
jgi:4,5-dihydroxyphthalate decarboxylase